MSEKQENNLDQAFYDLIRKAVSEALVPLQENINDRSSSHDSEMPLTVVQFAAKVGGSRQWIGNLVRRGLIPARKLGGKTDNLSFGGEKDFAFFLFRI
ncbi:helix-turn-helix domain-containing protein [bacterium]|nr:helix-turn-helix domain-containing protein [bacterium]